MPITDESRRILRAAAEAARLHQDQRRKGIAAEPYVNHLLEVAGLVAAAGGDADVVIAALLHDSIEDVGMTAGQLTAQWGARVAGLVLEVTDDKSLPKQERKRLQIVNAPKKSADAQIIKLADKTSNLRAIVAGPPVDWDEQRQREYFDWAEAVVAGLREPNAMLLQEFRKPVDAFRKRENAQ